MKTLWPRTLFGRNLIMLVALALVSQLCTLTIFLEVIQKPRIDDAAALIASQILVVDRLLAQLPADSRERELRSMRGEEIAPPMQWNDHAKLTDGYVKRRFFERLRAELPADMLIRWEGQEQHHVWVRLRIDGQAQWIRFSVAPAIGSAARWGLLYMLLILTAFPTLAACVINWRIRAPLRRLESAATQVKGGSWPASIPVEGPHELATVAQAFNQMIEVLSEMEALRAEMLAGISHDIRTPLTKLHLVVASPQTFNAPAASAERFIGEIDAIVQQFIDFARGCDAEQPVIVDLNGLIEQLAADYVGLGQIFTLKLEPLPTLTLRPIGMQRLLMNLMQNAVSYGKVDLAVETSILAGHVLIAISDGGAGIAKSDLAFIKQPFRRGADTHGKAGTGLGLAIAEQIARQHGGDLEITLRAGGGLCVQVWIPYH